MFERFTERARQVVVLAQEEARGLQVQYIGPEHLLLGVLREEEGLAARVLASLDVTIEKTRDAVVPKGELPTDEENAAQKPFNPRAKTALENALRQALSLGHNYIGTEHVLLGIIQDTESPAVHILEDTFKVSAKTVRDEVIRMLSGSKSPMLRKDKEFKSEPEEKVQRANPVAPHDIDVISTAVLLGRQYPDRPATSIAKAAIALHA